MNANPRCVSPLSLCACLYLALFAPHAHAQRRTQAKPPQPKATQSRPAPQPPMSKPMQTATGGKQVLIRWGGRSGIERYRLQVAHDRAFSDMVFDRAIVGLQAQVELPQGDSFFWRVAPAAQETGEFSSPTPLIASEGASANVMVSGLLRSPADVGWQALTGEVLRPQPAVLRGVGTIDVVVVNAEGTIFALDGTNGSTLWTSRYRPNALRGDAPVRPAVVFTPVVVRPAVGEKASIVVAFDGGVRALEGETGREVWRLPLPRAAISGVVTDLDDDKVVAELAIVTDEPTLHLIDARNGQLITTQKLNGTVIGAPVPFLTAAARGVALTLTGGLLDIRRKDGSRFLAVKFDVGFTTPPLIITGPNGALIVTGTEHGLLFLDGETMKPLGKITTEGDSPRGRLVGGDMDHDNVLEIAAMMKSGKVITVNAAGHIVWSAEGAGDAYSPTFADLNGDGILDVIVASEQAFVMGFDGRDGALLWQADETKTAQGTGGEAAALRSVAVIVAGTRPPLVVSGDAPRAGVRAVGLPSMTMKMAAQ